MYSWRVRGYSSNVGALGGLWSAGETLFCSIGRRRGSPAERHATLALPLDDEEDLLSTQRGHVEHVHLDRAVFDEAHADVAPFLQIRRDDPNVPDMVDPELARPQGDRLRLAEVDVVGEFDLADVLDPIDGPQDAAGPQALGQVGVVPERVLVLRELLAGDPGALLGLGLVELELRHRRFETRLSSLE